MSAAPLAVVVALPPSKWRSAAVWASYLWLFKVAHQVPFDQPDKAKQRVRVRQSVRLDSAYLLEAPRWRRRRRPDSARLGRLGFSAEVQDDVVQLGGCPCPLISPSRPDLICGLAAAALDGVLTGASDRRRVATRTHDHTRRRCTMSLQPNPDS